MEHVEGIDDVLFIIVNSWVQTLYFAYMRKYQRSEFDYEIVAKAKKGKTQPI